MRRILICFVLCLLLEATTSAHPGSGIVVDSQGQVYFTDTGRGVWKIDAQGKLTYMPASLFHWLAIDELGYFGKTPKTFGEWFERITPENSRPTLVMCSDFPLTVNADGNMYYADTRPNSARIVRRTPDGTESILAAGDMFRDITGITSGPDSSLYVMEASHAEANAIRRIRLDGTVSRIAGSFPPGKEADRPPPETPPGHCRGLAVDSQGVVYVAATGSRRVLKIMPGGAVSTILQATSPWAPTGVTLYRGEVYVLEWRDAPPSETEVRKAWVPRVRKIGIDGKVTTLAIISR